MECVGTTWGEGRGRPPIDGWFCFCVMSLHKKIVTYMVVPLLDEIPSSTKWCAVLSLYLSFSVPAHSIHPCPCYPSQPTSCPSLPSSLPPRFTAILRVQAVLVLILVNYDGKLARITKWMIQFVFLYYSFCIRNIHTGSTCMEIFAYVFVNRHSNSS